MTISRSNDENIINLSFLGELSRIKIFDYYLLHSQLIIIYDTAHYMIILYIAYVLIFFLLQILK